MYNNFFIDPYSIRHKSSKKEMIDRKIVSIKGCLYKAKNNISYLDNKILGTSENLFFKGAFEYIRQRNRAVEDKRKYEEQLKTLERYHNHYENLNNKMLDGFADTTKYLSIVDNMTVTQPEYGYGNSIYSGGLFSVTPVKIYNQVAARLPPLNSNNGIKASKNYKQIINQPATLIHKNGIKSTKWKVRCNIDAMRQNEQVEANFQIITFPESIKYIHHSIFPDHSSGETFLVKLAKPNDKWYFENNDGLIYRKYPLELLKVKGSTRKRVILIRETVTKVCAFCFYNSRFIQICLQNLVFPSSIQTIEQRAFKSYRIHQISFKEPSRIKVINENAFRGCTIDIVSFPSSLEIIEAKAFAKCQVKVIDFPINSKLREIQDYAFLFHQIQKVHFPASLQRIGYQSFGYSTTFLLNIAFVPHPIKIYFPKNSQLNYIDDGAFTCIPVIKVNCDRQTAKRVYANDFRWYFPNYC